MSDTPETDAVFIWEPFLEVDVNKAQILCEKLERERDEAMEALMKIEDRCVDCEDACGDIQKIRDIAAKALEGAK